MAGNQGLQYNYICPLSEEERQLQGMGYPWVTTNHLDPNGELRPHSHHSENTHLITRGSLTVNRLWTRRRHRTYQHGDQMDVPAHLEYEAQTGAEGCSFVEGHAVLSPTTRDRIERNDVAKAIRTNINIGHSSSVHGTCGTGGRTNNNVIRICRCSNGRREAGCGCQARTGNDK